MVNIVNFLKGPDLKGIALDDLKEAVEISIADEADTPDKSSLDKNFNAWALVNTSRTAAIAWLYDRTFSGDYSRGIVAPTLPPAPPLPPFPVTPKRRWLKIEKAKPRQSYRYDWFDTWEGVFITEGHGTAMTDKNGILKIPLPRFPTSTKTTVSVSHGNDIAIRITVNPYHP